MSKTRARIVFLAAFPIAGVGAGALAFADAIGGCADDSLIGVADAGFFDGPEAGANPATDCNACVAETCTGQWSACFASSDCVALLSCVSAASCDDTCRGACACASQNGVALFAAATACDQNARCVTPSAAGACNTACAAGGLAGPSSSCGATAPTCATAAVVDAGLDAATEASAPTPATCASCIGGACGDQTRQCPPTSDCDAYLACALACTSAACISDCGTTHATGGQAASELAQCVNISCASACAL